MPLHLKSPEKFDKEIQFDDQIAALVCFAASLVDALFISFGLPWSEQMLRSESFDSEYSKIGSSRSQKLNQ